MQEFGATGDGAGDVGWEDLTAETVGFATEEALVAGLEEVGGSEEGVITVEGVHQGEVGFVLFDGVGEVGQFGLDDVTELALGEEAGVAGLGLNGHALQDGLDGVEVGRKGRDGVHPGQEAARGGDHEGRDGHVVRTGVIQDVEDLGGVEGAHGGVTDEILDVWNRSKEVECWFWMRPEHSSELSHGRQLRRLYTWEAGIDSGLRRPLELPPNHRDHVVLLERSHWISLCQRRASQVTQPSVEDTPRGRAI